MNNRNARRLLLVLAVLLAVPAAAFAQRRPVPPESHRMLEEGSTASLEASMADRLRHLRESREMQQLVQRLMKNPEFLKDVQKNIGLEKLNQLREKVEKGEGVGSDETLKRLLDQARDHHHVSDEEANKWKRWAESQKPPESSPPPIPSGPSPTRPDVPGAMPVQPPPAPPPPTPPPSAWSELKDQSTSWLKERMTDLPDSVANVLDNIGDSALAESVRDSLHSLGRAGMDESGLPPTLQQAFRDLAAKVADMSDYIPSESVPWQEFKSLFQDLRRPSLPSFDTPSVSLGRPSASGDGFDLAWLWLAVLAVLGLILYKSTAARRSADEDAGGWRLGPWPVAPGAVTTRGDLVAAFEYLAFLRLGPTARTLNHLDVADELGEQSPDHNDQRRRAADELARLYEQARYAPEDDPLTEQDLATARRDLCMLAGVAIA